MASTRRLRPDVVLMDRCLTSTDCSITDQAELRSRVVILTTFERDE